jgi:hypothetical protein
MNALCLKWLSNTYNPNLPDAKFHYVYMDGIDREKQWQNYLEWLNENVISLPKETEVFSRYELMEMGYVGVYSRVKCDMVVVLED